MKKPTFIARDVKFYVGDKVIQISNGDTPMLVEEGSFFDEMEKIIDDTLGITKRPKQDIDHPDPPQVRRNSQGIYVYEPREDNHDTKGLRNV